MKKLLSIIFTLLCVNLYAQEETFSRVNLTAEQDQIRFLVPGATSYYLMSKTLNNNAALGLYSADEGGWMWKIQEGSGDMTLYKGRIGVGTQTPNAGVHILDNEGIHIDDDQSGHPGIIKMADGFTNSTTRDDMLFESNGGFLFKLDANGNGISNISGFGIFDKNNNSILLAKDNGNVGIGTLSPDEKLTVNGTIHSEEVIVDLNVPGPDYVFEEDYQLQDLSSLEQYLKANKHLPEIPSAAEMEEDGINVGEMEMLLLKKVEELTLHLIKQQKEIEKLKQKINDQN